MTSRYTVREFLDADLDRLRRASNLEELAARFTGQPLVDTVADLRESLVAGLDMEQFRRAHILISHLYHSCGADIELTRALRDEVGRARARTSATPERGGDHVLLEP